MRDRPYPYVVAFAHTAGNPRARPPPPNVGPHNAHAERRSSRASIAQLLARPPRINEFVDRTYVGESPAFYVLH